MLSALAAQSLAFAPAAAVAPRTAVRMAAPQMMAKSEALPFAECPAHCDKTYAGDVGFDPLGIGGSFSMKWMREAELKHGRVCQLAIVGYIAVDQGFLAPGAPAVKSLEAHDVTVKSGHMLFLLFVVGAFEALSYSAIHEMMSGETDREPGDYGLGQWMLEKEKKPGEMALKEITHCRLAMLAFSGLVTQSAMGGHEVFPYA